MRRGPNHRVALLVVALLAVTSACSLLVPTDGLLGGDSADASLAPESSAPVSSVGGGSPSDDGSSLVSPPSPESDASSDVDVDAEASPPVDASVETDALTAADSAPHDAGATDTGASTVGSGDAAANDAGANDAGANDAGANDAGARDAGANDAGAHDAGANDAGPHDAGHDAAASDAECSGDLSNIGTGDFHVSLHLRTTESGRAALVNQRTACVPGTFWDLRLSSGELEMETDDVTTYTNLVGTGPELDDGATHVILVTRVAGTITITVDGATSGTGGSSASFGALAPLVSGSDVCDGQDGTASFSGTISSLCVGSP